LLVDAVNKTVARLVIGCWGTKDDRACGECYVYVVSFHKQLSDKTCRIRYKTEKSVNWSALCNVELEYAAFANFPRDNIQFMAVRW